MTDQELQQLRRDKWRINGQPVRTLDDARSFIESVGFCQLYPPRSSVLLPTLLGAWAGSDERLPNPQQAFADARAREATELMVRLLRDHGAYEANLGEESNSLLMAASVFPYFYALVGERNPRQSPKAGARAPYSQLACDAHEAIRRGGPISKQQLLTTLGKGISGAALDRALIELWSKLRITRVDYHPEQGASWDLLLRWATGRQTLEPLDDGGGAGRYSNIAPGSGLGDRFQVLRWHGRCRTGRGRVVLWTFCFSFTHSRGGECIAGRA